MADSAFPAHFEHGEVEARLQKFWEQEGFYRFDPKDTSRAIFSVDTPPPYVSADHLHVGHAMSYSQAEFVVRYQRMLGKNIFYPMGFDDNGLPTERFVEKKYKINKNKIKRNEFVELCLQETAKGAETYKNLWRALGISVDWNLTYSTINPHCRKTSQKSFLELFGKGLIQRRSEPIIWCYTCQTSLAQADVETETLNSALHDIAFSDPKGGDLVISTTRPELIPACVALYVNPDDERYRHLVGQEAVVPVVGHRVPIKTDASVEKEFGTGLMMVCTWGDMEDVRKWKEHGLSTRMIFESNGVFNDLAGPLKGQYFTKAREAILAMLKEQGKLKKSASIAHNVGVHERCSTPIDFNHAPQWFIKAIEFKEPLLKRGQELKWHPEFMKVRFDQWVRDLKWDWNISRQRYYGVPFPVWYCGECKKPIVAKLESLPVDPMVDTAPVSACPSCKSTTIIPEQDVMDTWMTSSLTPLINAQWAQADQNSLMKRVYPMSLRPQAFEIIRTWLFYTVLKSHLHTNSLPWSNAMISGWGLDPKGRKISKSLGNFVDANEIIKKYSADALRFWAAGSTLGHDLRYNEQDVASGRKIVVKLWNAIKFVAGNLENANLAHIALQQNTTRSPVSPASVMIDRWVLSRLQRCVSDATTAFETFEYSHALRAIERFFWQTFCDNYLEIVKDRFWTPDAYPADAVTSARETLYVVTRTILQLFAPFLPFITDELWLRFFQSRENIKSVHISRWPQTNASLIHDDAEKSGDLLLALLTPIRKWKSAEQVHQNTQLQHITVHAPAEQHPALKNILADLASAARAKSMDLKPESSGVATELPGITLDIQKE